VTYGLFHHHGDAFMTLYSELPKNLTVVHDPICMAGASIFTVSANDSSVIALTHDFEIVGVALGTGAPIDIPIIPQMPGDTLIVTVTKANYFRYEQPVLVTDAAYVILDSTIIQDYENGVANPGETIDLGIIARNVGTETAFNVYGLLSTADSLTSVSVDSSWFGTLLVNDSACSNPYYEFSVANNCPDSYPLRFTLDFHDDGGQVWTAHPEVVVRAPYLTYQGVSVEAGNGNGVLEPGETVDLVVTLKNEGGMNAGNVVATLMTSSPYVTINDNAGSFGTIDTNAVGTNISDPYAVTASVSAPYGLTIDFGLAVQSGIYLDTLGFSLVVGQLVPTDTGYYYAYFSGGINPYAPVFDWVAIDSTQTQNPGISMNLDDDNTVQVNLPFTFRYYGTDYTHISVCSNGWIALGVQTTTDFSNSPIPNADGPGAMVAAMWHDLDPGNPNQPSDVYYFADTTQHRFIVEYFSVEHYQSGDNETFEYLLYDPVYYPTPTNDGEIVVQYLEAPHTDTTTAGIENGAETVGIQYYYNGVYDSLAL
jgi:hypothetical protein